MNRPGQPQQRPPALAQNPNLSNQFRPPYPGYGIPPPRNVLQGGGYVPGLQPGAHRTPSQQSQVQTMVSQTPAFIQQRGQTGFGFGGGLAQHQSTTSLQQQQSTSHQQQQPNGTSASIPPHLSQTPSLATGPSASSPNEVGLDPNDFPALGSTPASNTTANGNGPVSGSVAASYASQAGTGISLGTSGGTGTTSGGVTGSSGAARDFTPDDFPALGGQSQTQSQNSQPSNQETQSHPPGLNGFQHPDHAQQHRQNLLGTLGGGIQPGTPGLLNLGQSRNVHPGFQQPTETEKQRNNYSLKLNQATHAAWSSPNPNASAQSQTSGAAGSSLGTAGLATSTQLQQNGTHSGQTSSSAHLNAPPGVPPPNFSQHSGTASAANANASSATSHTNLTMLQTASLSHPQHPQTPAQQILVSAADRWGLLGLISMIKSGGELEHGPGGIGIDLGAMGLDLAYSGSLYSTFITPWADQSAARTVEPDFHLPSCYANVQASPPGPSKAAAFSDETLFFMFYSSPRDALQEVAAQELYNRNWRYHKDLRLWITKETGSAPSQKVQGGEQGQYTFWDPENWSKERKEMTVMYADLEEKNVPAFAPGPGLVIAQTAGHGQAVGQQQPQTQIGNQVQQMQRGSLQMGMAGL